MAALKISALALAALSLCACASRQSVRVGDSTFSEPDPAESESDEKLLTEELNHDGPKNEGAPEASTQSEAPEETDHDDSEHKAHPEPRELALARAALHRSSPPENHLDLAMAVSERASDLPWVMTIENRSSKPLLLAALPSLIKLELLPPAGAPVDPAPGSATKVKEPTTVVCQSEAPPKKLSQEETITLSPGEIIFHALDPRTLCEKEDSLRQGWTAQLSYGFPIQTRKVWRAGKMTEEEIEQKAPFVAERTPSPGDEILPLKILSAEPFVLGATYPLSELTAKVKRKDSAEESPESSEPGKEDEAHKPPPPPPLKLEVANLGASKNPEDRLVEVRVRNTTSKSIKIFLRRELITYEVTGPTGTKTCTMQPADRAPDPSQFESIAPGSSSYFPTRLAEACPPGTWDAPGNYSVSARMVSTASGSEHGMSAFTGIATTTTPARLTVVGDQTSKRPFLRIAPRHAPTPNRSTPVSPGSSAPHAGSPEAAGAPDEASSSEAATPGEEVELTEEEEGKELPAEEMPEEELPEDD